MRRHLTLLAAFVLTVSLAGLALADDEVDGVSEDQTGGVKKIGDGIIDTPLEIHGLHEQQHGSTSGHIDPSSENVDLVGVWDAPRTKGNPRSRTSGTQGPRSRSNRSLTGGGHSTCWTARPLRRATPGPRARCSIRRSLAGSATSRCTTWRPTPTPTGPTSPGTRSASRWSSSTDPASLRSGTSSTRAATTSGACTSPMTTPTQPGLILASDRDRGLYILDFDNG